MVGGVLDGGMEVARYHLGFARSLAGLGAVLSAGCLDDPLRTPPFAEAQQKPSGVTADAGDRVLRPALVTVAAPK